MPQMNIRLRPNMSATQAHRQQHGCRYQDVRGRHPAQGHRRDVELVLDERQSDVDARRQEHHQEPAETGDEQHQGAVGAGEAGWIGVECGHRHKVGSMGAPRPSGRGADAGGPPPVEPDGPRSDGSESVAATAATVVIENFGGCARCFLTAQSSIALTMASRYLSGNPGGVCNSSSMLSMRPTARVVVGTHDELRPGGVEPALLHEAQGVDAGAGADGGEEQVERSGRRLARRRLARAGRSRW